MSDLKFIRCRNVWLEPCWMVVVVSMCASSWHDGVRACALTCLYHIYYVNSDLCRHFFIDRHGIFPSLHRTISHPRTMSTYNSFISFSFPFVSTCVRSWYLWFMDAVISLSDNLTGLLLSLTTEWEFSDFVLDIHAGTLAVLISTRCSGL